MGDEETIERAKQAVRDGGGVVERLAERLGDRAGVGAVFADPVERDGITVIPVGRARWMFGGGGGSAGRAARDEGEGSGGGGAVAVSPMGYIVISQGSAHFRPIGVPVSPGTLLAAAFALGVALRGLRALLR